MSSFEEVVYPEIEPFDNGMLDVGDGNRIYWEACGNPYGKPAVVFHGGPGAGCSTGHRRFFDPSVYRIVLLDQRGCGRSTPHAGDYSTDLKVNTTDFLLMDIERLRNELAVEKWLVFGGSWGSTLALAYAERNPDRVTELILGPVTTTRKSEIDWLFNGVGRFFPEQWQRFREGAPEAERDRDLVAAYYCLLQNPDPDVRAKAARGWCEWEDSLLSADPNAKPVLQRLDLDFQMAYARIVTHYFRHNAWLEDGVLLREADELAGIPGVLVHGRLDMGSGLETARQLHQAWPDSELVVVDEAGHLDPGMTEALVAATDGFAEL